MKTLKLVITVFILSLFSLFNPANAQTYQLDLHATIDNEPMICLSDNTVSGVWTYHMVYRVNMKTGVLEDLHWNVKQSDLWITETGEKCVYVDSGKDNLGAIWDLLNNLNAYNEGYRVHYDVEDGWLPVPDPTNMPSEGSFVALSFKFIHKGDVYKWSTLWHFNLNANGELTANMYKEEIDCE